MIAKIVIPNVDKVFDYAVTSEQANIAVGMRVKVPFGRSEKLIEGVVIELVKSSDGDHKLKSVSELIDKTPMVTEELITLAMRMQEYYFCTRSQALSVIMPTGTRTEKVVKYVRITDKSAPLPSKLTSNQQRVVDMLSQVEQMKLADIAGESANLRSTVSGLAKRGIVTVTEGVESRRVWKSGEYGQTKALDLTDEQSAALNAIIAGDKRPFLLRGVTGSGKTEVYLQAIAHVLGSGKQAIVLVPEIALTPQIMERFIGRFGDSVSLLHSALSSGERADEWRRILSGDARVVVGARSAIFAPVQNLGMIIVDEEHESSYKSDHSPKYTAHEIAMWRAKTHGATLVLASATPSILSYYRAEKGEYKLLTMEKRATDADLPLVEVVDMRLELAGGNKAMFSAMLQHEILENLERGEQTILFLNRRGFSSFLSCRSCGESIKCKYCNVTLTHHRHRGERLICHYCDFSQAVTRECPACGSPYIRFFGDGTQKIEAQINEAFPGATYIRMDTDTTTAKNSHKAILEEFRDKNIDILIGTQMVAKGLDFANVTLVGVMAADLSLGMSDFRAFERSFAQLTQVCGRAGRGRKKGRAIIQTYQPGHYVINLAKAHDYESFYKSEMRLRENFSNPPLCDIIMITATGENEAQLKKALVESLKMLGGKMIAVPPAPAPISKIKGLFRWRTLIKCTATLEIRKKLCDIMDRFRNERHFRVSVDVNPGSML